MRDKKWDAQRFRVLLKKELRDLARDRKVLYAAILLPALLFPLLIAFSGKLFQSAGEEVSTQTIRVGLVGQHRSIDRLVALTEHSTWARGGSKKRVRSGELDAVVLGSRTAAGPMHFTLLFDGSRATSEAARNRLAKNIEVVVTEERSRLLAQAGGGSLSLPGRQIDVVDLAALGSDRASDVPRFLPMLLVLILLSASAFAAIDLFPGERERGTLETLLVQPARAVEVLVAKYAAVFCVGVVAIVANLVGMIASSAISSGSGLSVGTIGCLFALAIPLAVFLAAFLVRVVARAKSVREAQNYLLPLTLVCLMPPFVACSPDVPFDGFTACLPLAGPALAFREISMGRVEILPLAIMLLATCAFSYLILRGALKHLASEEHLLGEGATAGRPARGVILVLGTILAMYAFGPFFQGRSPLIALGIPLVLFVGLPPVVFGSWAGMSPRRLWSFRTPSAKALTVALCAGAGLALLTTSITALQGQLLPMPKSFRDAAEGVLGSQPLPLPVMLVLFALLPALFEELLYRRFLLDALLKSMDTSRAMTVAAFFFALHHLSIFRFFPTLVAGLVLGWIVISTHSFWTAPLVHALSNGLVVLMMVESSPLFGSAIAEFATHERWALLRIPLALVLIFVPKRWLYRREPWEAEPRFVG